MALFARYKTATGAGTLAALLLVLIFGGPWYTDWARDNTDPNTAGGWFLRLLAWPAWSFDADESIQDVLSADLRAILVVVFTALFLTMLPGALRPGRCGSGRPCRSPVPRLGPQRAARPR